MLDLVALSRICADESQRPHLARPGIVSIDGRTWTAATDGHFLMAVDHAYDLFLPFREPLATAMQELLAPREKAHEDRVERLRAISEVDLPCAGCGDTGKVVYRCSCPDCGHEHDADDSCLLCRALISVSLGGRPFDAVKITRLLRDVPDGPCRWAVEATGNPTLWIGGEGWRAALVGLQHHYSRRADDFRAPEVTP